MYISSFPTLSLKNLVRSFAAPTSHNRDQGKNCYYYSSGSACIYSAIRSIDLKAGDNILFPSYHCGVEIDAALKANDTIEIRFFRILRNLEVDIKDLERRIDKSTKAIFIIHYFGFIQPLNEIKTLCDKHNIYLIEDCAHALFSRYKDNHIGTFGDYAIFCMYKSLPLPNGGMLRVNGQRKHREVIALNHNPAWIFLLRNIILLIIENIKIRCGSACRSIDIVITMPMMKIFQLIKKRKKIYPAKDMGRTSFLAYSKMSKISKSIMRCLDSENIYQKRRENYQILLKEIKRNNLIFKDLPEGICPLFFPIVAGDRDKLRCRLEERGIQTFIFGKYPHRLMNRDDFPVSSYFSDHNLCIPIHQDLKVTHIKYIADMLKIELARYSLPDIVIDRFNEKGYIYNNKIKTII